jgi:hydroxyacid-oxoacid transhydrogenase
LINESIFNLAASSIRFGPGSTGELGMELADAGIKRVMILTDPNIAKQDFFSVAINAIEEKSIAYTLFDRVRVEPTDASFQEAIAEANEANCDAFVAIGGGSTIDTAKAANLYSTYPADFLDYVNAPIGKAIPVPGPLKPLYAIPTTSGTGSEVTGVAIFDFLEMRAKTGIASLWLKPTLGILDPLNTQSMPPQVVAATGLDVLSHAIESYTATPYTQREKAKRPKLRPAYQGSNPISDIWALVALRMVAKYLIRAFTDPADDEARGMMLLAASYAGVGFGNAGVHLPHGMSYPVSSMVRGYTPKGYDVDHPMIPHGMSVILNAPAVFRFTASVNPQRHLEAAQALGVNIDKANPNDTEKILTDCILQYMQKLNVPNGLKAIGFTDQDIPALVKGTLPQHRVTKLSPRPANADDLTTLFEDAMEYW